MKPVHIDCSGKGESFSRYWKHCVGAGRANEGMRADWRMHLRDAVAHCGFEYLRFHGLFHDDMMIYREKADGYPVYNWQYVDNLFDFMLDVGIRPFVEFGFMPQDLASGDMTVFWWKGNVTPPKNMERWAELIGESVAHWVERYGIGEVRKWYFEVWNEANLDDMFWAGTQAEYFEMYEATAKAVKLVDDQLRVGGPATSSFVDGEGVWIKDFLKFCAAKNLPADFISTHPYPVRHPKDEKTGEYLDVFREASSTYDDLSWLKKTVAASKSPKAEIHLTEWNSSPSPRDFVHDHPFAGAFIIKNNIECIGLCDSLSYWTFTDVFEEQRAGDTPFHGGFGLINAQGIHKPAYHAYAFLNQLGETKLGGGDGWFATRDEEEGSIQILLWNYEHYVNTDGRLAKDKDTVEELFGAGKKRKFDFHLEGLPKGRNRVVIKKVDMDNASAFRSWKSIGAPYWLTRDQVAYLKTCSEPVGKAYEVANGKSVQIAVELPVHGFGLVEVTRMGY